MARAGQAFTTGIRVWVVLSAQGHPVPLAGWAYTKRAVRVQYQREHGQSLEQAGCRAVRATLRRVVEEAGDDGEGVDRATGGVSAGGGGADGV